MAASPRAKAECKRLTFHAHPILSVGAVGNLLATGCAGGIVKLWDPLQDWACVQTVRAHQQGVTVLLAVERPAGVGVPPVLASGSLDHSVSLFSDRRDPLHTARLYGSTVGSMAERRAAGRALCTRSTERGPGQPKTKTAPPSGVSGVSGVSGASGASGASYGGRGSSSTSASALLPGWSGSGPGGAGAMLPTGQRPPSSANANPRATSAWGATSPIRGAPKGPASRAPRAKAAEAAPQRRTACSRSAWKALSMMK
jgi:hypothetical protein